MGDKGLNKITIKLLIQPWKSRTLKWLRKLLNFNFSRKKDSSNLKRRRDWTNLEESKKSQIQPKFSTPNKNCKTPSPQIKRCCLSLQMITMKKTSTPTSTTKNTCPKKITTTHQWSPILTKIIIINIPPISPMNFKHPSASTKTMLVTETNLPGKVIIPITITIEEAIPLDLIHW